MNSQLLLGEQTQALETNVHVELSVVRSIPVLPENREEKASDVF